MKAFIIWNADKTEGFVTTDSALAYEVRKSASTNCTTSDGTYSPVAEAFCKRWCMDDCTKEEIEIEEPSEETKRTVKEIRDADKEYWREEEKETTQTLKLGCFYQSDVAGTITLVSEIPEQDPLYQKGYRFVDELGFRWRHDGSYMTNEGTEDPEPEDLRELTREEFTNATPKENTKPLPSWWTKG